MTTHEIEYEVTEKRSVILTGDEIRMIALQTPAGRLLSTDPGLRAACEAWFEQNATWSNVPVGTIYKAGDPIVTWTKLGENLVIFIDSMGRTSTHGVDSPGLAQPGAMNLTLVYRPEVKE